MAGLVPAIHVFFVEAWAKTWMAGINPAMTEEMPDCFYFPLSRNFFTAMRKSSVCMQSMMASFSASS